MPAPTEVTDISRRVDLLDVAEESRKLPIKAISIEQATRWRARVQHDAHAHNLIANVNAKP